MREKKVQSSKSKVEGRPSVERVAKAVGRYRTSRITYHVSRLLNWFSTNARDLPWRRTHDPYAVWVSEIMLQQTQVKTVLPYFERWMRELPDVQALADASSEKIHKLWEGLGYYTRVRNMQKAAQSIVAVHAGEFPRSFDDVLALPGIGRYTAGAICSIAFNQPAPILDGNVIRVLTRVFGIGESVREKETNVGLWNKAEQLVQTSQQHPSLTIHRVQMGSCSALNQSLMELGALVCTPRQPRCGECPLARRCFARRKRRIELLPNLGERPGSTAQRFGACVLERDGAFWVRQRPAGVVNAHLWEFPNAELPLKVSQATAQRQLEAELGCALEALTKFATLKHTITRYRITLEAFRAELNGSLPRAEGGEWVSVAKADRLPFTSAHRRLLKMLAQDRNAGGTPAAR